MKSVPKKKTIQKLDEERPKLVRFLAADLGDARSDVDVVVAVLAHERGDMIDVLGVIAEMHADERHVRVGGHHVFELA